MILVAKVFRYKCGFQTMSGKGLSYFVLDVKIGNNWTSIFERQKIITWVFFCGNGVSMIRSWLVSDCNGIQFIGALQYFWEFSPSYYCGKCAETFQQINLMQKVSLWLESIKMSRLWTLKLMTVTVLSHTLIIFVPQIAEFLFIFSWSSVWLWRCCIFSNLLSKMVGSRTMHFRKKHIFF